MEIKEGRLGTGQGVLSFLSLSVNNTTPFLNDNIQLTTTVQCNNGTCPNNTITFHQSNDSVIQSNENILGNQPLPQLNHGDSSLYTINITVNQSGTTFYGACIQNQCSNPVQVATQGILSFLSLSVNNTTPSLNDNIQLSATVQCNDGICPSNTITFHQAKDNIIQSNENILGSQPLPQLLGGNSSSFTITIPVQEFGTAYYGACIQNQCSQTMKVSTQGVLSFQSFSVNNTTPSLNDNIQLSATVQCNNGICPSNSITFHLSNNPVIQSNENIIGNQPRPQLLGGNSSSFTITIPVQEFGTAYYGACIQNQCSNPVQVATQGILSLLSLSVNNTTPFLNDNIQLTATVQCNDGICPSNSITFHQSNGPVIQSNENILGNQLLPQLNHGDSSLFTINIPVSQSGTTYYGACIQNQCSDPVQVATQGILSFLSLSVNNTTPFLNDNIQLTTTVQCNDGICPSNSITFHQSNGPVIQSNENILGNQLLPQLNHGDSSLFTINIPVSQSGTTYYGACIQNQCSNPVQVATQGILSFLSLSVNNTTPFLNDNIQLTATVQCNDGTCPNKILLFYRSEYPYNQQEYSGNASIPQLATETSTSFSFNTIHSQNAYYRVCIDDQCSNPIYIQTQGVLSLGSFTIDNNSPLIGQTIRLQTNVHCNNGICPNKTLLFFRSEDPYNQQEYIGNASILQLATGTSASFPFNTIHSQNAYYRVCIDDQCSNPIYIQTQGVLSFLSLSVNNTAPFLNDNIQLTTTVQCNNDICPNNTITFHQSNDPIIQSNDNILGNQAIPQLNHEDSSLYTINITVNQSGTTYYGACIQNQCSNPVQVATQGILSFLSLSVNNTAPSLNDNIQLTTTVQCNDGICPNNTITFHQANDPAIQSNDNISGTQPLPQLNHGDSSLFTITIPVENFGSFYYGACIQNQCSNPVQVATQGTLSFLSLSVNNTAPSLNDNIQLTTTVQCSNGICPNNTITFHQSNNPVIQSNEDISGTQPLPQLNHGDSSLFTITIPVENFGTFYYGACIQNQCSNPVQVATQGTLSFLSLSVNNTAPFLNDNIRLTTAVQCNDGTCPNKILRFYRSEYPYNQQEYSGNASIPQLATETSVSLSINTIHSQNAYYRVCIDNQCSNPIYIQTQGVLSFLSFSVNNTTPSFNDNIQLTTTVQCSDGTCPNNTITFHQSNNPVIQSNEDILGNKPLAQLNDGNSSSFTITIPVQEPGTFYYGACIQNQCSNSVQVATQGILSFLSFSVNNPTPSFNDNIQLSAIVQCNNGICPNNTITFHQSNEGIITNQIIPQLNHGDSSSHSINITVNQNGTVYYAACIGSRCADGVRVEVGGTFIIKDISVNNSSPDVGEKIRFYFTTVCTGGPCGEAQAFLYRSNSTIIRTKDDTIGSQLISSLDNGEERIEEFNFTAENSNYYYGACIENSCSNGVFVIIDDIDKDGYGLDRDIDDDGDGLIEIRTPAELDNTRWELNGVGYRENDQGALKTTGCPETGCRGYELANDIDLAGFGDTKKGWDPIGRGSPSFNAVFEGNNFTIRNIFINRSERTSESGLFSIISAQAVLRNIRLVGVSITGKDYVGGIAGVSLGTNITNVFVQGNIMGRNSIGGLIGRSEETRISHAVTSVNVSGGSRIGGFVGEGAAIIVDSSAKGTVNGSGTNVGGFIGSAINAIIARSFFQGKVSGQSNNVGGFIGNGDYARITNSSLISDVQGRGRNIGGLIGEGENVQIGDATAIGFFGGDKQVGGLIGYGPYARITNSSVQAYIKADSGIVGGLMGDGRNAHIIASYAKSDVWGGGNDVGGLVGKGTPLNITASYAQGNTWGNGNNIGGLVGDSGRLSISSSYARNNLWGSGGNVGGLIGSGFLINIIDSYAVGRINGESVGGLIKQGFGRTATNSYWDSNVSGISSGSIGMAKTTADLHTGAANIYDGWTQTCPQDSSILVWDFGTNTEYPAIQCTPDDVDGQRTDTPSLSISMEYVGNLAIESFRTSESLPKPAQIFTLYTNLSCQNKSCFPARVRYYVSDDAEITPRDISVEEKILLTLPAGGKFTQSLNITAPQAGTYYYGVCIKDVCSDGVRVDIRGILSLKRFTVDDTSPFLGKNITLAVTALCSEGICPSNIVTFYLSNDSVIDNDDTYVGENSIPQLYRDAISIPFLNTVLDKYGTYYYGACIEDQCTEGARVDLYGRISLGDLIVNNIFPQSKERILLSLTISCSGGPCRENILFFYKSQDAVLNTKNDIIGNQSIQALDDEEQRIVDLNFTVGGIFYYYGACIDDRCTNGILVTPDDDDRDGYEGYRDIDDDGDGLIEIRTPEELHNMRWVLDGSGYRRSSIAQIDSTGCPSYGCHGYELAEDINLAGWGKSGVGWEPVGNKNFPFAAIFEGNHFTIRNMFINRSSEDDIGLFGGAATTTSLTNVRLSDISVSGRNYVGGLVGFSVRGSVENSILSGTVSGQEHVGGIFGNGLQVSVAHSSMTGHINAERHTVGGLIGYGLGAQITNSSMTGTINGTSSRVGGLAGNGYAATVISSFMMGNVTGEGITGGLIGFGLEANITNSFMIGNVTGISVVGGLAGSGGNIDITASYAQGSVRSQNKIIGTGNVGGLIGHGDGVNIIASYARNDVFGGYNAGGLIGKGNNIVVNASYAAGKVKGNNTGGLVGHSTRANIIVSYWDSTLNGIKKENNGIPQTTQQLKIGARHIYDLWTQTCPYEHKPVWDFGTTRQYPAIQCILGGVTGQRIGNEALDILPQDLGIISVRSLSINKNPPEPAQEILLTAHAICREGICLPDSIQYYMSVDAEVSSIDTYIGESYTSTLSANATSNKTIAINAPLRGTYYVGACVEKNCTDGVKVEIKGVLSVGNFSLSNNLPSPDERIEMSVTIFCSGSPCRESILTFYHSADGLIDPNDNALHNLSVSPLAEGNSTIKSHSVITENAGIHYYGACIENRCTTSDRVLSHDADEDGWVANQDVDDDGDGLIEIRTAQELHNMRWTLDGTGYRESAVDDIDSTGCPVNGCSGYELAADIDLAGVGETAAGWKPIGNEEGVFSTVFEGNDFVIRNLFINRSTENDIGLFGRLSLEGTSVLRNIHLKEVAVVGNRFVAGLVGYAYRSTIINSSITGNISGNEEHVGGLAGFASSGTITGSYAKTYVQSQRGTAGGLVGSINEGFVHYSHAESTVKAGLNGGGLIGNGYRATITSSSAVTNTSGLGSIGGLVGLGQEATIQASYAIGDVRKGTYIGGLVGNGLQAHVTASYAVATIQGNSGGGTVGGLLGDGEDAVILSSYAVSNIRRGGARVGGLLGSNIRARVFSSYWDSSLSGIDNGLAGGAKTTDELKVGMNDADNTPLYASWIDTCPNDSSTPVWNFGTIMDYPAIQCTPVDTVRQRDKFLSTDIRVEDIGALSLAGFRVDDILPKPDQKIKISADAVCNSGSFCFPRTVWFYKSDDQEITQSDTLIRTSFFKSILPGETTSRSLEIRTPLTGVYYYGACIADECTSSVKVEVQGSLSLESFRVNNTLPNAGERIQISVDVLCIGGTCEEKNIHYYISQSSTVNITDTLIENITIPRLTNGEISSYEIILRAEMSGSHYYSACLEVKCISSSEVIIYVETPGSLSLESFRVNNTLPNAGERIQISVDVLCIGGTCEEKNIHYYISQSSTVNITDTLIENITIPRLTNGEISSYEIILRAEMSGSHYYGACLEVKCISSSEVIIYVEAPGSLSLESFQVNNTLPNAGERIQISVDVLCIGGTCEENNIHYYISQSSTANITDTLIENITIPRLANGEISSYGIILRAEMSGSHYYSACLGVKCISSSEVIIYIDEDGDGYKASEDVDDDGDGLIEVRSSQELQNMRWTPDGSGYRESATDDINSTGCPELRCTGYELTSAIDLDGFGSQSRGWIPIGNLTSPFDTVFEGNNFTIHNMRIDRDANRVGFFGTLNPAATIRNIRLEKMQVKGNANTGGLVGYGREATIINAQVAGEINGSNSVGGLIGSGGRVHTINSRFIGSVHGKNNIGGLYGRGYRASLEDSSVIGIINGENRLGGLVGNGEGTTITNSSALINISGKDLIGGLIGNGARTEEVSMIISSYAKGNIRGRNIVGGLIGQGGSAAITTSYSISNITANDEVGGLVGSGYNATITASYAITHITANDDIGGIIGLPSLGSSVRDISAATLNATYAVATISGSGSYIGGLVGSRTDDINFIASYWDSNVNNLPSGSNDRAKTSEELQTPTSTSGIYSSWTQTCPSDDNKPVWNFGTDEQYPAIVCTPHGVSPQR